LVTSLDRLVTSLDPRIATSPFSASADVEKPGKHMKPDRAPFRLGRGTEQAMDQLDDLGQLLVVPGDAVLQLHELFGDGFVCCEDVAQLHEGAVHIDANLYGALGFKNACSIERADLGKD
jgi:hypothetical protein